MGRPKGRKNYAAAHKFTDEEIEFIRVNYPKMFKDKLTEQFNKTFGTNITLAAMKSTINRYNIKSGRTGRFEPGSIPFNKGKHWSELDFSEETKEKMRRTCFKKGNIPKNYRPVGSERINVDGYYEIKISDDTSMTHKGWEYKHVWVWKQHNGPVPKGNVVIFKDGNKLNCDISNLMLITKRENLIMNRQKLRYDDAELTEAGLNIAKLEIQIYNREKETGGVKDAGGR